MRARGRLVVAAATAAAAALAALPVQGTLGAWDADLSATQAVTSDSVYAALDVERAADGGSPGLYAARPGAPTEPLVRSASATATPTTAREARTTAGTVTDLTGATAVDTATAGLAESTLPPLFLPANRTFDADTSGWSTSGTSSPATAQRSATGGTGGTGALEVALTGAASARSGQAVWSTAFDFFNAVPATLTLHYSARVAVASGTTGVNKWKVELVQGSTVTVLDELAIPPTAPGAPALSRWVPLSPTLLQPDLAYTLRVVADLSLAAGAAGSVSVLFDDLTLDVRAVTALLPKNRKFTTAENTTDWTVSWTNTSPTGVNVNQWASSEGSPNDSVSDGIGGMRVSFSHGVTAAEQVVVWQTRVTLAAGVSAAFRYDQRYLLGDQLDRVNSRWDWYLLPPSASTAATAATSALRVNGTAPAALDAYKVDGSVIDPPPFPGTDATCPNGTTYWRHFPGAVGTSPWCSKPSDTSLTLGPERFPETGTYTLAVRVRILANTFMGGSGSANGASLAFDNVVLQLTAADAQLDSALLVPVRARRTAELAVTASTSGETFRVSLLRDGSWVPVLTVTSGSPGTQTVALDLRRDGVDGDVVVRFQDGGSSGDTNVDTLSLDRLTVTGTDPPPVGEDADLDLGTLTRATDTGRLRRAFVLRNVSDRDLVVRVSSLSPLLAYAALDVGSGSGLSSCTTALTDGDALASQCRLAPGASVPVDVRVVANGRPGTHRLPLVVAGTRPGAAVDQTSFYRLTVLGALVVA